MIKGALERACTFLRQEPKRHDRGRWTDRPVSREPRRQWLGAAKLVLVDGTNEINVAGKRTTLSDFARSIAEANPSLEVVAESVDVTSEEAVAALFARHGSIRYLQHTAGISPRPLTPPEELTKEDVLGACEVNLSGAHNVLKQGIRTGAFAARAHGVIILSTSATVGSEGRASAAYEESKGGLRNLLMLGPLLPRGTRPRPERPRALAATRPQAAQNPISAGRLQAVEDSMPIGGLTDPSHIAAATMYFWSNECWCVGEVLTVDGGYTKHRPIYGAL